MEPTGLTTFNELFDVAYANPTIPLVLMGVAALWCMVQFRRRRSNAVPAAIVATGVFVAAALAAADWPPLDALICGLALVPVLLLIDMVMHGLRPSAGTR